jgi:hypothetical protein
VVGLGVALALSGCSAAGSSGESTAQRGPAPAAAPTRAGEALTGAGAADAQTGGAPPAGAPAAPQRIDPRSIIYTGDITVRVEKVDQAATQATAIAETAGGFVGSDKRTINDDRSEVHLQLRVPAEKFTSTLDALAKLGTEEARSTSTEDVTEAIVDVDARIESQRASVARTRALLAQARNLGEIVSIEAELAKREGELASLEARKRRLADLTSLSTLTVHLLGPDAEAPTTPTEKDPSFLDGLEAGWNAFLGAMNILLVVLGYLLPFAVVLGLPIILLVWLSRRRRPRLAVPPGTPPATYGLPAAPPLPKNDP